MIRRVITVSNRAYLRTENEQLVIDQGDSRISTVPIEDLGLLEIDGPQVTITSTLLGKLSSGNVATIICDAKHHPSALVLPLSGNSLTTARLRDQISLSEPKRKRAWKHTVESKIRNQLIVLKENGLEYQSLKVLASKVASGDSTNREGAASVDYWKRIMPGIRRARFGESPNNLLNYGYAVIRAAVARGIVRSGLHPALGIHHQNQYNDFCLADDLMEPYRPFVDKRVISWCQSEEVSDELTPDVKRHLLSVLYDDCILDEERSPLWNAILRTTASFASYTAGKAKMILYPRLCESANIEPCG